MEIKVTKINKSRFHIKVAASKTQMEDLYEKAYIALAPSVSLPGFRPGKAPRSMTVEAIGAQRLANAAIEEAIRTSYIKALKDNKLNPLGNPNIKIIKQPSFIEGSENILEYEADLDILPEVKFIKDYKKIKLSPAPRPPAGEAGSSKSEGGPAPRSSKDGVGPAPKQDFTTNDEEIDQTLQMLRRRRATFKSITRGAKNDDKLEITFQGFDGHVALEKLGSKNHPIILGSKTLIPGFEEKLVGIKKDEKREFDITFPKEYHAKEFAGKKYHFEVTADNVEEVILPKEDNEFAKSLGAKSLEDLKNLLKKNIIQEKKNRAYQKQEDEVVNEIVKIARTDLPEILVNSEKERLKKIVEDIAQKQGVSFDQYLKNIETTPEKFDEDMTKQAAKNVLIGLSLRQIAQNEKIEIGKDESLTKVVRWLIDKSQLT